MFKRHKLNRRRSERSFTRGAGRVHRKNFMSSGAFSGPMRGGIRL